MKQVSIIALFMVLLPFFANADVNTEKAMSKIGRDDKTYISSEARASTEDEAYNTALTDLSNKIAEYFKSQDNGTAPDAIYLNNLSSIYSKLSSRITNTRYRVMLYVKKSDLMSLGNSNSAMVLSKKDDGSYEPVPTDKVEPLIKTDTIITVQRVEVPLNPVLSSIASTHSKNEIVELLKSLRKSGKINGAAAFPIASADEYYLVVINHSESLEALLRFKDNKWENVLTGQPVNLSDYKHCSAYWITLH